jgi:hypothetical protein
MKFVQKLTNGLKKLLVICLVLNATYLFAYTVDGGTLKKTKVYSRNDGISLSYSGKDGNGKSKVGIGFNISPRRTVKYYVHDIPKCNNEVK